ncbi:MAG: hypothetical protein KC766_05475 [Myxococcales bacterium]|nr:hypothetical protein [Myxococcales bacterium]
MTDEAFKQQLLSLAHRLGNCLLVVQGNTALLRQSPADVKQVVELSGDVQDASEQASQLVAELQRLARAHASDPSEVVSGTHKVA